MQLVLPIYQLKYSTAGSVHTPQSFFQTSNTQRDNVTKKDMHTNSFLSAATFN